VEVIRHPKHLTGETAKHQAGSGCGVRNDVSSSSVANWIGAKERQYNTSTEQVPKLSVEDAEAFDWGGCETTGRGGGVRNCVSSPCIAKWSGANNNNNKSRTDPQTVRGGHRRID